MEISEHTTRGGPHLDHSRVVFFRRIRGANSYCRGNSPSERKLKKPFVNSLLGRSDFGSVHPLYAEFPPIWRGDVQRSKAGCERFRGVWAATGIHFNFRGSNFCRLGDYPSQHNLLCQGLPTRSGGNVEHNTSDERLDKRPHHLSIDSRNFNQHFLLVG